MVKIIEEFRKLIYSLSSIIFINRIIPIKHFTSSVTGDIHDNRFLDSGLSHISVKCMPQVVKYKTALYKSSVFNSCFFASLS